MNQWTLTNVKLKLAVQGNDFVIVKYKSKKFAVVGDSRRYTFDLN